MSTIHPTKQRLLDAGIELLLQRGYNDLGIEALLQATGIPRGSFYHHFHDKEAFALASVDAYMGKVHEALDACLSDTDRSPLERVRSFFERTREAYAEQGYMGCLLGGLGQELSGVNETFRRKVAECLDAIASRLATCLELARREGQLPRNADTTQLSKLLVDCWEGAALRTRLQRDPAPLTAMLDFYFASAPAAAPRRRRSTRRKR